jgi:hypothetical protein
VNACSLRPLQRADYPIILTDAELARLQAAFPTGVCDWDAPGIGETATVPWLTYQDEAGRVIHGGCPLPPPPAGSGGGWAGAAFAGVPVTAGTEVCAARAIPPPGAPGTAAAAAAVLAAAPPGVGAGGTAAGGGTAGAGDPGGGAAGSLPGTGWDPSGTIPALLVAVALLAWRLRRRAASTPG